MTNLRWLRQYQEFQKCKRSECSLPRSEIHLCKNKPWPLPRIKSDPRFLAGSRFQTGPWELRTVAAKNKSHNLIRVPDVSWCFPTLQQSSSSGCLCRNFPGFRGDVHEAGDYPITLADKQPKPELSITSLLKSSCDSWDGFPTGHHSLLRLCPLLWLLTSDSPLFLRRTAYCSGQFQSLGSGAEDTVP